MRINTKHIILLLFLSVPAFSLRAGDENTVTRILILLDASQSMHTSWEQHNKMDVAKSAINTVMESYRANKEVEFALRVYGHTTPESQNNCKDTRLEVPFAKNNGEAIKKRLQYITPRGTTPIAYALERAAGDFPADLTSRNIIILITDGLESCGGDPCAVSLRLQRNNIILKPFVIGIAMQPHIGVNLECIGSYYDAQSEAAFHKILASIVEKTISATSIQINLLDASGKPTESDANMTFYDATLGLVRHNYYHTLNQRGVPDTLALDPVLSYNLAVHTTPPLLRNDIPLTPGKHNILSIPAPQGYLRLELQGTTISENISGKIRCLVRRAGSGHIVQVQDFNTTGKYLVGKYDLEFLTLPRIVMKNIDISQSKTTTLSLPSPGLVTLSGRTAGYGGIFAEEGSGRLTKIYALNEKQFREVIALQPGSYRVIFRTKSSRRAAQTVEKSFKITANTSVSLKLD